MAGLTTSTFAGLLQGAIKIYSYSSATDAIATIKASDYFASADLVDRLDVGDLIIASGTDGRSLLYVSKVVKDKAAMEVDTLDALISTGFTAAANVAANAAVAATTIAIADLSAVVTADATDAATSYALANALKVKDALDTTMINRLKVEVNVLKTAVDTLKTTLNAEIAALKAAGAQANS